MNFLRRSLVLSVLIASGVASATPDPETGRAYYTTCSGCHGLDGRGNPQMDAPNLTILDAQYILTQLRNFSTATRGAPGDYFSGQMQSRANALPGIEAMADVAIFLETLSPITSPATLHGDAIRGRTLYESCGGCHGAQALGDPRLAVPRLAGASDWYLARQLQNFRSGSRGSQPADEAGTRMRPFAMALPDERAIADVIAYIATLR